MRANWTSPRTRTRQVQALGDVFAVLRRIEARLARLDDSAGGAAKHIPIMRKALVRIARGQQALLGGLEAAGAEAPRRPRTRSRSISVGSPVAPGGQHRRLNRLK